MGTCSFDMVIFIETFKNILVTPPWNIVFVFYNICMGMVNLHVDHNIVLYVAF